MLIIRGSVGVSQVVWLVTSRSSGELLSICGLGCITSGTGFLIRVTMVSLAASVRDVGLWDSLGTRLCRVSVLCSPPFCLYCMRVFSRVSFLIQANTFGAGLCYRCRLYKCFYDLKRQQLLESGVRFVA